MAKARRRRGPDVREGYALLSPLRVPEELRERLAAAYAHTRGQPEMHASLTDFRTRALEEYLTRLERLHNRGARFAMPHKRRA